MVTTGPLPSCVRQLSTRLLPARWIVLAIVVFGLPQAKGDADERTTRSIDNLPTYEFRSVAEWTDRLRTRTDDDLRRRSAVALGVLAAEAKSAVPALIRALSDEDTWVRIEAAGALGKIGPEAAAAVPALIDSLADGARPKDDQSPLSPGVAPSLRDAAMSALAGIGFDAEAALPRAIGGLDDPSVTYRERCMHAVMRLTPDGPVRLIEFFKSGNRELRADIIWALDGLDDPPSELLPALVVKLDQFDDRQGIYGESHWDRVLDLLKRRKRAAVPVLESWITDPHPTLCVCVTAALADLSPDDHRLVPILIEGLKSPALRSRSAEGLGKLGPKAKQAIERLVTEMRDPAFRIRSAAALARIAPSHAALKGFLEDWRLAFETNSWPPKTLIIEELVALGSVGVGELTKLLNHPNGQYRATAIECLGRIGADARPALPLLIELLERPLPEGLRQTETILRALRSIGIDKRHLGTAPKLLEFLTSGVGAPEAEQLLGQIGAGVVPDLIGIVDDRTAMLGTRVRAAQALGFIGDDAQAAAPAVAAFLESNTKELDGYSTFDLVEALGRIGKDSPEAAHAVAAEFPNLVEGAGSALRLIGRPAIVPLGRWLDDDRATVRLAVVETLAEFDIDAETIRPYILRAANDPDFIVRQAAVTALGQKQHATPDARAALLAALHDMRMPVRAAAAQSLFAFQADAEQVVPALIEALHDDYLRVRVSASRTLGRFGRSAADAVPALKQIAADDKFATARIAASDAIKNIAQSAK